MVHVKLKQSFSKKQPGGFSVLLQQYSSFLSFQGDQGAPYLDVNTDELMAIHQFGMTESEMQTTVCKLAVGSAAQTMGR